MWSAEAYGSDAVTPLAWVAAQTPRIHVGTAIMQIAARTPTLTATTALTLDQLSGGRFLLGLGVSGPQVVEGWHGVPFGKPLARTREYVEIVRAVWRREKPLEFKGAYYQIPYAGPDATGLGKPLKSILHGRADIPIYLAAIGPKNVALAAEIADGVLPIFFSPERIGVFLPHLEAGFARGRRRQVARHVRHRADACAVVVGADAARCRDASSRGSRSTSGGMGARGKNFYNELVCRYGYEADAAPDPGPLPRRQEGRGGGRGARRARRRGRAVRAEGAHPRAAGAWRALGITTLICAPRTCEAVRAMAELVL